MMKPKIRLVSPNEPAGSDDNRLPHDPQWLEEAISTAEAARLVGFAPATLKRMRVVRASDSPPFIKYARAVRYRRGDLLAWMADRRRRSTSDA